MSSTKVAVVTGGNKGIGYAIVRGLCNQFDGDVLLTARNEELGQKAVKALSEEGLRRKPYFHQLDITDKASIERLGAFLKAEYGGLDLLINNAGILFQPGSRAPFREQAEVSIKTNYTGTLDVCTALFPLLKPHARVVNVSSLLARTSIKQCSQAIRAKFTAPDITIEKCTSYLDDFIERGSPKAIIAGITPKGSINEDLAFRNDGGPWAWIVNTDQRATRMSAKQGTHKQKGYSDGAYSAYGMSKVGVSALTMIQAREMAKDPREDIVINVCCPGYVATDMTSNTGTKTADQGADTPLYLGLLPPGTKNPKGCFVSDRKVVDWTR